MPNHLVFSRALLTGACTLALASPAFAQQDNNSTAQNVAPPEAATQPATTTGNSAAEEIIVTAQHRVENVQHVPIAISVVSGDTLKREGITDFSSLQKVAPSLQIVNDTSNTRVTVRGVGTLSNNEAQDQSIAVNIDGEYINRPQILNASIFDMDRVEVLRGPQGTLYGKNSTGGAVNFITRKPGKRFSVNASASYGNYNAVILEAGMDVPLGDIGGVRIAGIYSDHDGYNRHNNSFLVSGPAFTPRPSGRSGDDHTLGGRASLRLNPVNGLVIDAAVEHIDQTIHPAAYKWVNLNANQPGPGCTGGGGGWVEVGPNTPGTQCIPLNTHFLTGSRSTYDAPLTGVGLFKQKSTAIRGKVSYDFGPATFTYTGGYRDSKNHGDNTLSVAYLFTNFGASVKSQSHEARLNGDVGGIQWQTGVFYFREKQTTDGGLYLPCVVVGPTTCLPFLGPNGSYITYFQHPTDSKSLSGFAQVEVPIVQDKLVAVAGGRYTDDKRHADFRNFGFVFNSGPIPLTGTPAQELFLRSKGHKFTWLGGLNYTPNKNTLIYGKVSTGYKAGGFDSVGTFKPESNTAYEGGLKYSFGPGRRNFFNAAGFYYDYKDLQNDVLLNPAVGGQTFNAGKATIYGIEADSQFKLTPNDTLSASVNYLHARYGDFLATYPVLTVNGTGPDVSSVAALDGNVNLKGNHIPQTPSWIINVGYDHVFHLGSAGTLTARANTLFKSSYYMDFFNFADSKQKAYHQTDLTLTWKSIDEHWSAEAFVRNLENKRPLAFAAYVSAGPDDIYNWAFGPPRTYGVRLSLKY